MTPAIQQAKRDLRFWQSLKFTNTRYLAVRCGNAVVVYLVALLVILAGRRLADLMDDYVYGKGERLCA